MARVNGIGSNLKTLRSLSRRCARGILLVDLPGIVVRKWLEKKRRMQLLVDKTLGDVRTVCLASGKHLIASLLLMLMPLQFPTFLTFSRPKRF